MPPFVECIRRFPSRLDPYVAPSTKIKIIEKSEPRPRRCHFPPRITPDMVGPAYPIDLFARARYVTPDGRRLSAHAWKLYDQLVTIPRGTVVTYGTLAKLLSSSAQAIGQALKANPFAPTVPCHRVIASNLFIGGFQGEWNSSAASSEEGSRVRDKMALLKAEGVEFDERGFLVDATRVWVGP